MLFNYLFINIKVLLVIKTFLVDKKKIHKKLSIVLFLGFSKINKLNTEIKNNFYTRKNLSTNGKHIPSDEV